VIATSFAGAAHEGMPAAIPAIAFPTSPPGGGGFGGNSSLHAAKNKSNSMDVTMANRFIVSLFLIKNYFYSI
jgi:hypothetical protein